MIRERCQSNLKHARHGNSFFGSSMHDSQSSGNYVAGQNYGGAYSRERYGSGVLANDKKRRAKKRFPRWLTIILAVLLVFILGVGGYALWFGLQLDKTLSSTSDTMDGMDNLLAPADYSKPFYVLLLGSDSREGTPGSNAQEQEGLERSDVIILVRVDAANQQLTLVSVPRDTPYELEDGSLVKINEVFNREGAAGSVKAISELTGVSISHCAQVGFTDLKNIVDALGGVDVNVNTELSYWSTITQNYVTIPAGQQTLNGEQAQIFARARHEYSNFEGTQDMNRQNNVRQLLAAILKKTLDRPVYEIPGIVLQEAQYTSTTVRSADLVALAVAFGANLDSMTVYSGTGPSNGDFVEYADGQWLCYRNPEGWANLMSIVDTGGEPTGVDYEATQQLW